MIRIGSGLVEMATSWTTLKSNEILVKDSLDFDPEAIKRMMAKGYADACALPPG